MVKQIIEKPRFFLCFLFPFLLSGFILPGLILSSCFLLGCAGGKSAPEDQRRIAHFPAFSSSELHPENTIPISSRSNLELSDGSRLWSRRMNGAISGLSASANGKAILVATSPDADIPSNSGQYLLSWLNSQGRLNWQKKMKAPVKDQDLAGDGSFAVISNYAEELMAWNAKGKLLWITPGVCRPRIMNASKKILCYHDDDAEPMIAFDVFNWKGKKLLSYPISSDILTLKLSSDEKNLVMGQAGGSVSLLDSDFHLVWKKTVEGEIIDTAVSSGAEPQVAVLYKDKNSKKNITLFSPQGRILTQTSAELASIQIEIAPNAQTLFTYGNGAMGQSLAAYAFPLGNEPTKQTWPLPIDYASSITLMNVSIRGPAINQTTQVEVQGAIGYEASTNPRRSHIATFDASGQITRDFTLTSDLGSYLYSYKIIKNGTVAIVATDDAQVAAYRLW